MRRKEKVTVEGGGGKRRRWRKMKEEEVDEEAVDSVIAVEARGVGRKGRAVDAMEGSLVSLGTREEAGAGRLGLGSGKDVEEDRGA